MVHSQKFQRAFASDSSLLLVEEMQHRVANEYALAIASINLFSSDYDWEIQSVLKRATAKLHDFAAVHRVLQAPVDINSIELCSYLQVLCAALTRAILQQRRISLILRETSIVLDARCAWRVGLILSELINNAACHGRWAEEGRRIEVSVEVDDDNVHCCVADNAGATKVPPASRGTHIVGAIARELSGQVYRGYSDIGTTIGLIFPHGFQVEGTRTIKSPSN